MAEIAVNFIIDGLVPVLQEEAKLLRGVSREAKSIIAELKVLKPFLRNADERDARGELDEGVKEWVKQVRQVSHQIEDVIDEYMLHLVKRPQRRGFIGFFYRVGHLIRKLKPRHDIASQIQDVKRTISELNQMRNTYGFSSIDQQASTSSGKNIPLQDPRVASLFIEEAEVVGIESPRNELISWLVEGSPKRGVISVVGMGGIGKTTLAKKVYDHPRVTAHFNCHAWITVSETYKMEELLKIMIKKLYKESAPEDIDVTSLIERLRNYLEGKRYVVVFDDVWDSQFWGFIKNALPDKADKGSRVVITTRKRILSLSYFDLPYHLKLCYLYFGIFPEDFSISCVRLIRLWIAERLVQRKDCKTLEEVAEEYLTELIYRNLVHDMMRDKC